MLDYSQHSAPSTYLPEHLAEVLKRLRESERRARYLFDHNKLPELRAQTETIEHLMREYYRPSPVLLKNIVLLRSLNKLRKREELRVIYNQALIQYRGKAVERAVELLVVGIEEITNAIEGEKMRMGFMDKEEEAALQEQTLKSIAGWQMELAKFYYYLGVASQEGTMEVALAAVLKSLDIVKELYLFLKRLNRSKGGEFRERSNVQQAVVVCQIWERVSHSRKFGNVSKDGLLEVLGPLLSSEYTISERQECEYNKVLMFSDIVELQMRLPNQSLIAETQLAVSFRDISKIHFFSLSLMSKLQAMKEDQFQATSNARNALLNVILAVFLYKNHLPRCLEMDNQIEQFRKNYYMKEYIKQVVTIDKLLNTLGVKLEEIKQPQSLRASIFQNKSTQKVDISAQFKRKKRMTSYQKEKRSASKQDLKSKQKLKTNKNQVRTNIDNKRIHREKVKCEYMPKSKQTIRRNHLVEAINKVGTQTNMDGTTAEKRPSAAKRITFENRIRASKSKDAKRDARERLTANQKNKWR